MYTPNPGQAYVRLDLFDPDPDDDFFVNWHHAGLLQTYFPRVYGILTRGISQQSLTAAKKEVELELHRMIYAKQCPVIGKKVAGMLRIKA